MFVVFVELSWYQLTHFVYCFFVCFTTTCFSTTFFRYIFHTTLYNIIFNLQPANKLNNKERYIGTLAVSVVLNKTRNPEYLKKKQGFGVEMHFLSFNHYCNMFIFYLYAFYSSHNFALCVHNMTLKLIYT